MTDDAGILTEVNTSTASDCSVVNENHYKVGEHIYFRSSLLFNPHRFNSIGASTPSVPSSFVPVTGVTGDITATPMCIDTGYTLQPGDVALSPFKATVWLEGGGSKNEKSDNYNVDPSAASGGVSVGSTCIWTEANGSYRPVTITVTGASLTIYKTGGGTYGSYASTQTVQLPAGSYTYEWTALTGYTGSGDGEFTVAECPPASATVAPGTCEYDDQALTSSTDVVLTISNATITI